MSKEEESLKLPHKLSKAKEHNQQPANNQPTTITIINRGKVNQFIARVKKKN
jgi:hypothetical protein